MKVTGTLINYYFHCKRQCYMFANRLNMEDNSEDVRIGRVLHKLKAKDAKNSEIKFANMSVDKITNEYIIEYKKSDSDARAARMQLIFYLRELSLKGINKKGKLSYLEKNSTSKQEIIELNEELLNELEQCENAIKELITKDVMPEIEKQKGCKKCAYYEYCYI